MALEGRRFRRRKKEDVFVEGYFIDHANISTPDINKTDETFHLYGKDSPETDVQHNFGTLTLGVLDKYTNNAILDLITAQDPADTAPHRYQVDDLTSVHVWANVKDTKNTKYVKSWFMGGWSPGLPMPSGNPEAKAEVQIAGNGHLPYEFPAPGRWRPAPPWRWATPPSRCRARAPRSTPCRSRPSTSSAPRRTR